MKIEYIDINSIKPYENNPRINRKTINKLKELLHSGDVEFNVPLVLDRDNVIVKGHARWNALKELGHTIAPVIYSDNTDEINNEDRLQDNIIQELSTWKDEELSIEIREHGIDPIEYGLKLRDIGYDGVDEKDVTQGEIDKAEEDFLGLGNPKKEYIDMICPYCGEEFMLAVDEIERIK